MNNQELAAKVNSSMYRQCRNRGYATAGLKPSFCCYKQWGVKKKGGQGRKPVIHLRFSKSGNPEVERWYATHFVDTKRVAELKAETQTELPAEE